MATWEDGPEYAPHERPQYFADAPVAPLEQAPPAARPADGQPTSRPHFDEPSAPVAALATLVPEPPDERDPHLPFDTVTTTLTSESPWGASQPFVASAPFAATASELASAPTSGPLPQILPTGPVGQGVPQPPADPYAFPVPGTPEWFAPPPTTYGDQRQPGRVDAKQVVEAATPGLCIVLAVGGLIYVLAPVMLIVAVILSTRVKVAQRAVRIAFRIAAGAVAFFALVGLVRSVFDGDPWWSYVGLWSLLICWVMLGVTLLVVRQGLSRPRPPAATPPSSNPWG
ncbi:MFS transporter [Microlunatus antarcticus]|uniref:Uncharacterized protein n=1 Tax=Microlunatus antarcticus TaxID=53388 RepID=A0A7W5P5M7_9ACTN|nr:hypothetical protein [Microlunatus antarcticus]MBB3325538.1 hypothetical protein [Microlunatus antarcticus]